jgi:hypothetical protein
VWDRRRECPQETSHTKGKPQALPFEGLKAFTGLGCLEPEAAVAVK